MSQMISGVEALYSRNILYRDLKLDNILFCFTSEVDKNNLNMLRATAKITDFAFAIILNRAQPLAHTLIGTPTYMERTLLNNTYKNNFNRLYSRYFFHIKLLIIMDNIYPLNINK